MVLTPDLNFISHYKITRKNNYKPKHKASTGMGKRNPFKNRCTYHEKI